MDDPFPNVLPGSSPAGMKLPASSVLLLTRADIAPLLSLAECVNAVEVGFRASARGGARSPGPLHVLVRDGGFHAKGAWLEASGRHVAVKINSNFPFNPRRHDVPTIQGVIALFDAKDGRLLALMDSIEITLRRTAAASALAARHLARRNAATIAMCGCGEQARARLAALVRELPLRQAYAWDLDIEAADRFAAQMSASTGIPVAAVSEMRAATLAGDIHPFRLDGDRGGGRRHGDRRFCTSPQRRNRNADSARRRARVSGPMRPGPNPLPQPFHT